MPRLVLPLLGCLLPVGCDTTTRQPFGMAVTADGVRCSVSEYFPIYLDEAVRLEAAQVGRECCASAQADFIGWMESSGGNSLIPLCR
jgi:hypothetical protein